MDLFSNVYFLIVVLYFITVIIVSFFTKKLASRSAADYLVAGRNLGLLFCSVVVAAEWLGGMSTIGVSERAFNKLSYEPILYNISTALGMIIIGYTVAKYYRKNNVHTVSEMIEILVGREAKKVSAIAFMVAYIILAYVQLQTATSVMSALFKLDWLTSTIIAAGVITIYTYIGGMHALAVASIMHTIVKFVGIGIAMFVGLSHVGGFSGLQSLLHQKGATGCIYNPFNVDFNAALSLFVGGILGGMAAQASIQPIFAAKDVRTAQKASILSSIIIAPFGIMTATLGLIAATGLFVPANTNPKLALTTLLTNPEFIHPVFGGLALAGILAAILSTVGPVNFAVVTIATKDIYHGFINPQADEKKIIQTARKLVVLVSLISVPLAYFLQKGILDSAYISYAIRAIGAIVILIGIYSRNWLTEIGVKLAFIGGTITVFLCMLASSKGWFHLDKTYGAIIIAIISLFIGYFISKRKKE